MAKEGECEPKEVFHSSCLSLQERVVGTVIFKMDNQHELLCSTGNSAQLYDSLDGRDIFGTRIHSYIQLSPFTVHLKPRVLLISYTPIRNSF